MSTTEHRMQMAKLSPTLARRLGLSSNHHARVWCECMRDGASPVGYYSGRPVEQVRNDPRRLGGWDWLGVVDLRVPNSALDLFRAHTNPREQAS